MKKMHPLLLGGIALNLLYAAMLSFGLFHTLIDTMPGALAVRLLSLVEFVLWFGLGLQALSIALVLWVPRVALVVGLVGCAPYFPVGLIFAWGLRFTQYEAQYAAFDKT